MGVQACHKSTAKRLATSGSAIGAGILSGSEGALVGLHLSILR